MKIQKHLDYCLAKARELPKSEYNQRLWSVVLDKRGNVLGEGSNSFVRTSPFQKEMALKAGKPMCEFMHSEITSLTRAHRNKSRAKPYAICVGRVGRQSQSLIAKPCSICSGAIESAGIQHVFYSL